MARISGKQDTNELLLRLGSVIRERRRAAGWSQETLADASGVDRSHMGKIERGERNVTTLLLIKIAAALHVTVALLFEKADL